MELKGLHIEWLEGEPELPVKVTDRRTEKVQHIHLPHFIGHFSICPVSEDAFHIQHTQSGNNVAGFKLPAHPATEKSGAATSDQRHKNPPMALLDTVRRLINLVHIWFSPGHSIR